MKDNDTPNTPIIEPDDERGGLEGLLIRSGAILRGKLNISNSSYHFTYPPSSSDPKAYFLFGVLNEVEKAVMSTMHTHEFVKDSAAVEPPAVEDEEAQRISDNILQAKLDEMALWQRKMTEFMVELNGFMGANSKDYYQHYLVLHELQSLRRAITDLKEYYAASNSNYNYQESELIKKADELATKLDPSKCWYAVINKTGNITKSIENFDTRFNAEFKKMKIYSRATLKTHLFSFGKQSKSIHAGVDPGQRELKLKSISAHAGRVEILAMHVLVMVKDLLRIRNAKGHLKAITEIVKKNDYPIGIHKKQTRPDIRRGDFVSVNGDLCQVVRVIISKGYRYKSFKIKYLLSQPLPGIVTDEVPGDWVRLLYQRDTLTKRTIEMIKQRNPAANPTVREINRYMREGVIESWDNGLKEYVQNRPDLGKEKLDRYITEMKEKYKNG